MITKTTAELQPGDVVDIFGTRRTISSVTPAQFEGMLRVNYVPIETANGVGGNAESDDVWQVDSPSPLDLAVQRAQELADEWFNNEGITGKEITELMNLFRAAR